ncbi:GAF domain-containing protein [Gordonia sp. TBRC 11910]|uniref:GAF domain-containing protein n=1 Tax=Gordonia asplenii TaxID=2725283 RepID=A0A848KZR8_9ACTN|nr:LuxR C-terminal-related transcriptional regulator [Gordonia asplenii]NMO04076.1 GAF domain-containing protein [Gordonia asplenii]
MSVELSGADVGDALTRLRADSGVSLAFLGVVEDSDRLRLRHFVGSTMGALRDIPVAIGHGLGGKVVSLGRPIVVDDYLRTSRITHRYDRVIAAEGLRAMAAAPIIVDRRPVAVLYAALHTDDVIGGRTLDSLAAEARAVEQVLIRRAALAQASEDAALHDRVALAFARIRQLSGDVDDPLIAAQLTELAELLRGEEATGVALTQRELDVISLAALGYSNSQIAAELTLTLYTVKSYMRDAMRKLGASNRREAVVLARRGGLIA